MYTSEEYRLSVQTYSRYWYIYIYIMGWMYLLFCYSCIRTVVHIRKYMQIVKQLYASTAMEDRPPYFLETQCGTSINNSSNKHSFNYRMFRMVDDWLRNWWLMMIAHDVSWYFMVISVIFISSCLSSLHKANPFSAGSAPGNVHQQLLDLLVLAVQCLLAQVSLVVAASRSSVDHVGIAVLPPSGTVTMLSAPTLVYVVHAIFVAPC